MHQITAAKGNEVLNSDVQIIINMSGRVINKLNREFNIGIHRSGRYLRTLGNMLDVIIYVFLWYSQQALTYFHFKTSYS